MRVLLDYCEPPRLTFAQTQNGIIRFPAGVSNCECDKKDGLISSAREYQPYPTYLSILLTTIRFDGPSKNFPAYSPQCAHLHGAHMRALLAPSADKCLCYVGAISQSRTGRSSSGAPCSGGTNVCAALQTRPALLEFVGTDSTWFSGPVPTTLHELTVHGAEWSDNQINAPSCRFIRSVASNTSPALMPSD